LTRLVLSLALVAFGAVVLVDVAGARVPASVYFAVPLTVVGGGLVIGAWYGRARRLIAFGAVLGVLLAITAGLEGTRLTGHRQTVNWRPAGVQQLDPGYRLDVGNAELDLSALDFAGRTESVAVHVSVGNLRIVLPPNVDVEVTSTVKIGNATVLGERWSGIGQGQHTVTDLGADGAGGGNLTLDATVNVGDLEVRR
jgi:hypothetical protein